MCFKREMRVFKRQMCDVMFWTGASDRPTCPLHSARTAWRLFFSRHKVCWRTNRAGVDPSNHRNRAGIV